MFLFSCIPPPPLHPSTLTTLLPFLPPCRLIQFLAPSLPPFSPFPLPSTPRICPCAGIIKLFSADAIRHDVAPGSASCRLTTFVGSQLTIRARVRIDTAIEFQKARPCFKKKNVLTNVVAAITRKRWQKICKYGSFNLHENSWRGIFVVDQCWFWKIEIAEEWNGFYGFPVFNIVLASLKFQDCRRLKYSWQEINLDKNVLNFSTILCKIICPIE